VATLKWKLIGIALSAVIIGINIYLINKDNSKVARSFYIDEWATAKEQNLNQTMKTDGVSSPSEELPIYYDEKNGSFKEFLVKKNEEIEQGTSLFQYSTDSYDEAIENLETEKSSLEKQLEGLEEKLENLEDLQSGLFTTSTEKEVTEDLTLSSIEIDIYQTEADINRVESEIDKYDELISSADKKVPNLEIKSTIDGVVKDIHYDLSNPIMTIASLENKVSGVLTESEQPEVKRGMKVVVTVKNTKKSYNGFIEEVAATPMDEPNVNKESHYPFTVIFEEVPEKMAHGTHVDVKIYTKEIADALTVPFESILKTSKTKQVMVLENGKIEKRKVTTGVHVNKVQQIEKGLKVGEIISQSPLKYDKKLPTFYTPLNVKEWDRSLYKEVRKKKMLQLVGKGFLTM
jgi:HlyD family secretion protein